MSEMVQISVFQLIGREMIPITLCKSEKNDK